MVAKREQENSLSMTVALFCMPVLLKLCLMSDAAIIITVEYVFAESGKSELHGNAN
jgi:hypothetical protein